MSFEISQSAVETIEGVPQYRDMYAHYFDDESVAQAPVEDLPAEIAKTAMRGIDISGMVPGGGVIHAVEANDSFNLPA